MTGKWVAFIIVEYNYSVMPLFSGTELVSGAGLTILKMTGF